MRNVDKHEVKHRKIPAKVQIIKRSLFLTQQDKHIAEKKAYEYGQGENGAKNLKKHQK